EEEGLPLEAVEHVAVARALGLGADRLREDDVVEEALRVVAVAGDGEVLIERLRVADELFLAGGERERIRAKEDVVGGHVNAGRFCRRRRSGCRAIRGFGLGGGRARGRLAAAARDGGE